MNRARRYYVIHEDNQWKVKLEGGRVVSTHRSRRSAIRKARKFGRNNNRPVMVNYKDGRTGAVYYSKEEV